jgi:hypothetical protein
LSPWARKQKEFSFSESIKSIEKKLELVKL